MRGFTEEIGYNGPDATALATSSRPRNADRSRATMPVFNIIPTLSEIAINVFWSRIDVQMYDTEKCWPWKARIDREGYGRTGRNLYSHRVAFTIVKGPIPDGLTIDHRCQNRRCCNPDHLEAVSVSENIRRRREPTTRPTGKYQPRKRTAARYGRRRERGVCVQCSTPSEKYRCDRCRPIHNARQKGRKR